MDRKKFQENLYSLISYMNDVGYSDGYIQSIKRVGIWILNSGTDNITVLKKKLQDTYPKDVTLKTKLIALNTIFQYHLESITPDEKQRKCNSSYVHLSVKYKQIIDLYRKHIEHSSSNTTSINITSALISFFLALQEYGVDQVQNIQEHDVRAIFDTDESKFNNRQYVWLIKKGLNAISSYFPEYKLSLLMDYLPDIPTRRVNIQYLSKEECDRIINTLSNDNELSLRTKAIGTLAFYTGMRVSDIALLKLDSIDWDNNIITFTQRKTQVLHKLPLLPIVGNAIYNYIIKERSIVNSPFIFLSSKAPYRQLTSRSLGYICKLIFNKANVRVGSTQRKGFHLFRHHLATTMLGNDIAPPIITATLGHSSSYSLESYLSSDFSHLKECALDISWIPMNNPTLILQ